EPFVLVSSHLMRRRDRHKDLLEAEPYALVVLDEAPHARTRRENNSSGGERLRPNTLMQLMQQLRQRTNGLLLLTATPMQVSELEVWDLLALLGMPPEWTEDAFEKFFEWVEKENPDEATLAYLAGLWRSSVTALGRPRPQPCRIPCANPPCAGARCCGHWATPTPSPAATSASPNARPPWPWPSAGPQCRD
ncbi:MAG: hypothetical protein ACKO8I_20350, partial [Cyanobacteriota bacterium]